jgi:L-aminopeptidase/D-esterase-like protein
VQVQLNLNQKRVETRPHRAISPTMASEKKRARDFFHFDGQPGALNAITDIVGLEVGMVTLISGEGQSEVGKGPVRTGVTAILPRGKNSDVPCAAGIYSHNGNGELTGSHWIKESGALTSQIMITNTAAIGPVHAGVIDWHTQTRPGGAWLLPVIAETYDGYLHDITGNHVKPHHAGEAMDNAKAGIPVPEGSVGGGTGMNCYSFKGGSGTSSRLVKFGPDKTYTVATFLQNNFGSREEFNLHGVPLGQLMTEIPNPLDDDGWWQADMERDAKNFAARKGKFPPGAGSVIAVVATDAPMLPTQCEALARRVSVGDLASAKDRG